MVDDLDNLKQEILNVDKYGDKRVIKTLTAYYNKIWKQDSTKQGDWIQKIEKYLSLPENLTQDNLEKLFEFEIMKLNGIFNRLAELNVIEKGEQSEITDTIFRIKHNIGTAKIVLSNLYYSHAVQEEDPEKINWNVLGAFDKFRTDQVDSSKIDTNTVKKYVTYECAKRQYKRHGEYCCERISINGKKTHAYKQVISIKDFMMNLIPKGHPYWDITAKEGTRKDILAYLTEYNEPEDFPELVKNRNMYSFKNGTWINRIEEDGKIVEKFYPLGKSIPTEFSTFAASKYFDCNFDYKETTPEEEDNWFDIIATKCPNLMKLMQSQRWSIPVQKWFVVMITRCMYSRGDLDNWQVDPYFLGLAGTGKSTAINYIAEKMFETVDVGAISNNCERKFALQSIYDKFIIVASEVKKDFCLEQATWQQMISSESVSVAIKHKDAKIIQNWDVPGIYAGNEVPDYADNSGAVSRRLLIFRFDYFIDPAKADDKLPKKLELEVPYIMLAGARGYLNKMNSSSASTNIWNIVPAYFKEQRMEIAASTHALQGYLEEMKKEGIIKFKHFETDEELLNDKQYYVYPREFKDNFMKWCVDSGKQKPNWKKEYYDGIFKKYKIKETPTRRRRNWPPGEDEAHCRIWFHGICYTEYFTEDEG